MVLGDTLYVLGVLVPVLALLLRQNYMLQLVGFILGTIGFLVFVSNNTDITFSASVFYLAFLPLALGLLNLALFYNWVKEERW